DVTLSNAPAIDQQNTAGTNTGTGFDTPNWTGQTFIPAVTGLLARVDIPLFCSGCTGTTPNLTLSVRATSAGLPTGADLASATIPWSGTTPANTSLKFQLAGSNNVNGPFNFVGPDGTAGTFFSTSPVQLSPQFYNFRFLEYKAFLATTDGNVTPTLSDATACFN